MSSDQVKETNNNKYIRVFSLVNQNDIIIGRSIDADIIINDISLSNHRTFVLIKNPFEIKEKKSLKYKLEDFLLKWE